MSNPETASSSSTFLELGWTSGHISIGTGYDYAVRQLRVSALESPGIPVQTQGARKVDTNIQSVTTEEDLKARIKADFKANIPLEGVSITTENSYLSSVETSDTTLTQIIQETITDQPAKLDVQKLNLTNDALAVLNGEGGWKNFSQKYGEYFVYGFRSRATFSAICNIKTSSKESRDEIKSSLSVGAPGAGELGVTLESMKQQKSATVAINIDVHTSGLGKVGHGPESKVDAGGDGKILKTNKVEEVQNMYDNFKKNFETEPFIGLLCHYSAIDKTGKIPQPADQFAHLGPDLERMYKTLYTAQVDLSTSSMVRAKDSAQEIVSLCEEITKINVTDAKAIQALDGRVKTCLTNVDHWRLRSDLLQDVAKLSNEKMVPGDWIPADSQREWASGVVGINNDPKYGVLAGDVSWKNDHFKSDSAFAAYTYHDYVLGDNDKIVIGYKLTSYWNDDSNGWYKVHHANVLSSQIKIQTSSFKTRGCDWELEVWQVPKTLYETKK